MNEGNRKKQIESFMEAAENDDGGMQLRRSTRRRKLDQEREQVVA